jgi:phage-related protein
MSQIQVVMYREVDGSVPALDWFADLPEKAQDKCRVRLERLAALGHELRRPEADYLRDDIYELRVRFQTANYRMLYFFHGRATAVLSHGVVKEDRVPPNEIDRAADRKRQFDRDPSRHTFAED